MTLVFAINAFGVELLPGSCVGWVVAGLIGGWLAGKIVQGKGFGCLEDILLGVVGAFLAAFFLGFLSTNLLGHTATYHFIGTTVLAFLGALVLGLIVKAFRGSAAKR
jgi:uncharacterized membrane protein YeaQ/YmgE (transglycosylase-associated protein family)